MLFFSPFSLSTFNCFYFNYSSFPSIVSICDSFSNYPWNYNICESLSKFDVNNLILDNAMSLHLLDATPLPWLCLYLCATDILYLILRTLISSGPHEDEEDDDDHRSVSPKPQFIVVVLLCLQLWIQPQSPVWTLLSIPPMLSCRWPVLCLRCLQMSLFSQYEKPYLPSFFTFQFSSPFYLDHHDCYWQVNCWLNDCHFQVNTGDSLGLFGGVHGVSDTFDLKYVHFLKLWILSPFISKRSQILSQTSLLSH